MFKADISQLSEETGRRFGEVIANGLREFLKQPGAREQLDAMIAAREARQASVQNNCTLKNIG